MCARRGRSSRSTTPAPGVSDTIGPLFDRRSRLMTRARSSRRVFLKGALTAAAVAGVPLRLGAQPRTIKVGVVSPITGAMAEVGGDCRLGAQMAADAINAAGGIKSLGGARVEPRLAH